jgi:hypothetical protein
MRYFVLVLILIGVLMTVTNPRIKHVDPGKVLDYAEYYLATGHTVDYALVRGDTYVIAASNSSNAEKSQSDVVCDGTQDDVEIQAGLDSVSASSYGGVVKLLEGLYTTSAVINMPNTNYVTLEGMGPSSTTIKLAASANCAIIAKATPATTKYRCRITRLGLDGNSANNPTGTYGIDASGEEGIAIDHVRVTDCKADGIYSNGTIGSATSGSLRNIWAISNGNNGIYLNNSWGWFGDAIYSYGNGKAGVALDNGGGEHMMTNISCDQNLAGYDFICNGVRNKVTNLWIGSSTDGTFAHLLLYNAKDCMFSNVTIKCATASLDTDYVMFYAPEGGDCSGNVITGLSIWGDSVAGLGKAVRSCRTTTGTVNGNRIIGGHIQYVSTYLSEETSNPNAVTIEKMYEYIAPGEIRTYSGTIGTLTENAYNSVDNPFGQNVLVLDETIYISTKATSGAPRLDCGIGSSATTDYTTVFDDITCETVGPYHSTNTTTIGKQTSPILWQTGTGNRYFNHSIKAAAATGLVATYTIRVMGV